MLKFVSYVGTRNTSKTARRQTILPLSKTRCEDSAARINPRKSAPQSPIKIFARGKFRGRKPSVEPSSKIEHKSTSKLPKTSEMTARQRDSEAQIPPASPLSPSVRLIALDKYIIHANVNTPSTKVLSPDVNINAAAAPNCPASFLNGDRDTVSSKNPTKNIVAPPRRRDILSS